MSLATLEPIVKAEDLFDDLDNETEELEHRRAEVRKDPRLDRICGEYQDFLVSEEDTFESYPRLNRFFKQNPVSSKEIENFSKLLPGYEFQEDTYFWDTGVFISAMINSSPDLVFKIYTNKLSTEIQNIGIYNKKDLTIIGYGGRDLGQEMRTGRITVYGDAGFNTANCMRNGIKDLVENMKYPKIKLKKK